MPDSSSTTASKPPILDRLPDFPIAGQHCAIRIQQELDLLLLALESLDLGEAEGIFTTAKGLGLEKILKNRIFLWRLRCTNPWRRAYTRNTLTLDQAKTLTIIICDRAKNLSIIIRQLLLAQQQMEEKNLPVANNYQLSQYLDQFQSHFRSRMNPRRAKVSIYLASEDELNELGLSLLNKLLFCSGSAGMQRLWVSLFDGEVA